MSLFSSEPFAGLGPNRYDVPIEGSPWGGMVTGDGRPALRKGITAHAPQQPGIYAMLDGQSNVLYVGKAKRLRTRLLNYFRNKSAEQSVMWLLHSLHSPLLFGVNSGTW